MTFPCCKCKWWRGGRLFADIGTCELKKLIMHGTHKCKNYAE